MKKYSQDLQFLSELETDKIDIAKIKQQRQLVTKIQSSFTKKDHQIQKLKSLLQKYQHYQQKYTCLKVQVTERMHLMSKKENECRLLKNQIEDLMREQENSNVKIKNYENERQNFIRERHAMQTAHKEVSLTFKEYQSQFRKRENLLSLDLERAYQQIKEANTKIDELELIAQEKKVLEERMKDEKRFHTEQRHKTMKSRESSPADKAELERGQELLAEVNRLKSQLILKQEQLTANRILNYELTVQYDSSINTICSLQTELSSYRKENNEIKKILSLLRQQERCREIEEKYTLRNKTQFVTPMSDCENSSSEEDVSTHNNYMANNNDAVIIQS